MPFLAPFVPALIGGAAAIGASALASNAGKKATQTATNASNQAATANNALQQGIYNDNKATLAPFIGQGQSVVPQVNALLGSNPFRSSTGATFETSPYYSFLQNEGMRGVNAGFGDAIHSGGRLKALQDRSQMIANGYQNQWFNQDQANLANMNQATGQYLNALTGQQGMGLSAAGAQAGVGLNYANNVSNNNWQAANNTGNAALVNGQNQNALMGSIANVAGQFLSNQPWSQPNRGSSYGTPPNVYNPVINNMTGLY